MVSSSEELGKLAIVILGSTTIAVALNRIWINFGWNWRLFVMIIVAGIFAKAMKGWTV